jgi:GT2 family glycosyltransferase
MISVVCVYNNRTLLERSLLESLGGQARHQLILVDNTDSVFSSAAKALNYGARRATGKYILFVHQDVELFGYGWLQGVEATLDSLENWGIAGVIGMSCVGQTKKARVRGFVWGGENLGNPVRQPERVQTLDEIVLLVPRGCFQGFDQETFDGWHCYGADYCLTMLEQGRGVYVVPGYVIHGRKVDAPTGQEGIRQFVKTLRAVRPYLKKLYGKHGRYHQHIYTTTNGMGRYGVPLPLLWSTRVFSLALGAYRVYGIMRRAG